MADHETFITKRGVKIFKNPKINATEWIRRITVQGKQVYFRLGKDRKDAGRRADQLDAFMMLPEATVEDALARFDSRHATRKAPKDYPSIGDLLEVHRKHYRLLELREKTARDYRNSICYVVRVAMAHRKKQQPVNHSGQHRQLPEAEFSVDVIKPDLFEDFQAGMVAAAGADMKAGQVARRSANSYLSRAKAFFSLDALDLYARHGLKIPDLDWLRTVRKFRRVDRGARYVMPPEDTVLNLFTKMAELDQEPFKLALLCLHAGLRREEALQARRSWIVLGNPEVLHLQAEDTFLSKNSLARAVELCPGVGVRLDELSSKQFILSGSAVEREATADELVAWLRENGLARRLPLHELRKLFGAFVASDRGIYVAQRLLGHLSPQVTSDYYSDVLVSPNVISAWKALPLGGS